jgi:hypothetical protein
MVNRTKGLIFEVNFLIKIHKASKMKISPHPKIEPGFSLMSGALSTGGFTGADTVVSGELFIIIRCEISNFPILIREIGTHVARD